MAIADPRQKLQDVPDNFWKILLYADSGAGKTVTGAMDRKVLVIAVEKAGILSAKNLGSKADVIFAETWDKFKEAAAWCEQNAEILGEYDYILIDSLTELQKVCMIEILKAVRQERITKNQDPDQPQVQDYGKLYILLENAVRLFNDLPCNVMYTALAKDCESPTHETFLMPMLGSGKPTDYKFSSKIVALMTSFGYLREEIHDVPDPTDEEPERTKEVLRRVIYWEKIEGVRGKDRTTKLGPFTINVLGQHIRKLISGELSKDENGFIIKRNGATPAKAVAKKIAPRPSPQPDEPVESTPEQTSEPAPDTKPETTAPEEESEEPAVELETVEA